MARNRVLIEFVKATEKRQQGDRVWVDKPSSVSLVHRKKVARIVDDAADTPVVEESAPAPVGDDAA